MFEMVVIIVIIRFPKDRTVAAKWNLFLGVETSKILNGMICCMHFEDQCFERRNKARIKANSVPTIFEIQSNEPTEIASIPIRTYSRYSQYSRASAASTTIAIVPTIPNSSTVNRFSVQPTCPTHTMLRSLHTHPSHVPETIALVSSAPTAQTVPSSSSANTFSLQLAHTLLHSLNTHPTSTPQTIATATLEATSHQARAYSRPSGPPTTIATASSFHCDECIKKDALIEIKEAQIRQLRNKLKKAQKKIYYLETVKRKLNSALSDLKKKWLVDEQLLKTLDLCQNDDLFRVLHHGNKGGTKYPESVRRFSLGLVSHSARAYQFVRKSFNNHLPSPKTIQQWFANSDIRGEPGIQLDQMERLKKIAQEFKKKHNRPLMCSLVFDEIHIRQQVVWSVSDMEYTGYANYGTESTRTIAKQAIVFLLNGIEVSFEFPLCYYFIHELKAPERQKMLEPVIAAVTDCEIKLTNITCDGLSSNIPTFELLGASLTVNCKGSNRNLKPFIVNPINEQKIFIILDPCHMEKLVRNRLASCGVFFLKNGDKIEWRFIEELYKFSCTNDFRCHKLTKKHIEWRQRSMNVSLAVETFSESTARSIEYLMNLNVPQFQDAQATIDFIRRMNVLFDIFNSKCSADRNIFKRNLCPENKRIVFDFIKETAEIFKQLKVEETFYKKSKQDGSRVVSRKDKIPILNSRHKTSFRGFIIDIESLMGMYKEYVEETNSLKGIATYNIVQDPLEMLFARIRHCGGYNNNPNVLQFKGAFRKVQCNMRMELTPNTNCRIFDNNLPDNLFYSNIYFVSSKRARMVMNETTYQEQKESILKLVENEASETGEAIESTESIESFDTLSASCHYLFGGTSHFMVSYLAAQIEKKISKCNTFHCSSCRQIFDENDKDDSIDFHFSDWVPCSSTIQICKHTEKFFKLRSNPAYDFKVVYVLIFRSLNFDLLYTKSSFNCDHNHKYQFIKCIVGQYISMRARQLAKEITLERQGKLVRQKLNHLINFKGQ